MLEYQRALWSEATNLEDSLNISRKILKSCYKAGLYSEIRHYTKVLNLSDLDPDFASKISALAAFKQQDYGLAAALSTSSGSSDRRLLRGVSLLYLNAGQEARKTLEDIPNSFYYENHLDKEFLIKLSNESTSLKKRSPLIAGISAFVPGGGYAYNGLWQTAASTLLLNTALYGSSLELRKNGLPISSAIVALISFGYHLGSIYGSISAVNQYNIKSHRETLNRDLKTYLDFLDIDPH